MPFLIVEPKTGKAASSAAPKPVASSAITRIVPTVAAAIKHKPRVGFNC